MAGIPLHRKNKEYHCPNGIMHKNNDMHPRKLKQLEYLYSRGLEDVAINHFKLGNIGLPYYSNGQIKGIKVKKHWVRNKYFSIPESVFGFFNKNEIDGSELIITEGEFDVAIVHQCGYMNVVSVGTGANRTDKLLAMEMDFLNKFESIIVLGDNATAGARLEDAFKEMFGLKAMEGNFIHTNLRSLDYALNDLAPKMLTLITGRSNGGKSTLVN